MPKRNDSLGMSITRLKGIVNSMKMSDITESHAFAIKIIASLSLIISEMEVPELIGGIDEEAKS